MMPVVWTRAVKSSSGKVAKVLTTTMGASQDLENEAFRRLLVNGTYWSLDKEIPDSVKVDIEGSYKPSKFSFNGFVREKAFRLSVILTNRGKTGRSGNPVPGWFL